MRKRLCVALVVSGALAATTAGFLGTAAHADDKPPKPPGISADGTVDPAKAPKAAPVVGPDGKLATDAAGRVRQWQTGFGVPPPPPGHGRADGLRHQIIKGEKGRTVEMVEVPPLHP